MNLKWVPNSLSLGNLFLGFLSIIFSSMGSYKGKGYFVYATIFILIASVFDVLDGRIARKMNHHSPLGKDLDSLADLVSFGLAPGIMFFMMFFGEKPLYSFPLEYNPVLNTIVGVLISFLFPLFGALRLAKFNVTEYKGFFMGLPSPIAGGSCALLLVFNYLPNIIEIPVKLPEHWLFSTIIFVFFAFLMISKFVFPKKSPSFMNFSKDFPLTKNLLSLVFLITLIIFFKFFLLISTIYYTFKPIILFQRKPLTS